MYICQNTTNMKEKKLSTKGMFDAIKQEIHDIIHYGDEFEKSFKEKVNALIEQESMSQETRAMVNRIVEIALESHEEYKKSQPSVVCNYQQAQEIIEAVRCWK